MRPLHPSSLWLVPALACAVVAAPVALADGSHPASSPKPELAAGASTGLVAVEGGLLAGGADYEARLDARGVTFVPVLGAAAPEEQTLRFEACAVERGGMRVAELSPSMPRIADGRAVYDRGAGVLERYDVRAEGLEQSFVLERPLGTGGDLVVRGRLGGALADAARPQADGGLSFDGPFGGVRFGAVTGIDAAGRTCPGSLRVAGGERELELELPGSFVDAAAYPLVIDPLIGAVFRIDVTTNNDSRPDVAFDASYSTFLVVWQRTLSASSHVVRGQRLDIGGNLVGGTIFFTTGTGTVERPQVASANYASRFVVVWKLTGAGGDFLRAQLCDPTTGGLSSAIDVETGARGSLLHPDVGGGVEALVVWDQGGVGIVGARLDVPLTGDPTVVGSFNVALDTLGFSNHSAPSISKTGGIVGLLMVVYLRRAPLIGGDIEVRGTLIDHAGTLIDSLPITLTAEDELEPDVDGGSVLTTEFLVAWWSDRSGLADALNYAAVRWDSFSSFQVSGPFTAYFSFTGFNDPSVAWTPGKAHIAVDFQPFIGGSHTVSISGFDMQTGARCEGPTTVASLPPASGTVGVGIASVASGGAYGHGRALLAFTYAQVVDDGNVFGHLVDAFGTGSSVVDLGGGCGLGGTMGTQGVPSPGNGFFGLTLTGADPASAFAVLNVSSPQATFNCGPCQWLPFQSVTTLPVTNGTAGKFIPIPCDPGLTGTVAEGQWTVLSPSSSPCPMFQHVSLSNRISLTIGN